MGLEGLILRFARGRSKFMIFILSYTKSKYSFSHMKEYFERNRLSLLSISIFVDNYSRAHSPKHIKF